ncbi:MAG: hypothetical protein GYA34_13405 [Chloroflexi bacterium]|nr:hypothetical protein [Chloroflexota bacterium]
MKSVYSYRKNHTLRLPAFFGYILRVAYYGQLQRQLRVTLFALVLFVSFITNPITVSSASSGKPAPNNLKSSVQKNLYTILSESPVENPDFEPLEIKEHIFKFYIASKLVPDIDFAKMVLPKYVEDMNTILAKNTNRRLIFNPETDIIITDTQPHTNYASLPLPEDGFEIWAHILASNYSVSYGGYGGLDISGAGVLGGLRWRKLYDPETVSGSDLTDYWVQINNMLHELAHVYKAGIGEYYKLATIQDTTGIPPYLNINVIDPNDAYWRDKPDFMTDPLLRNATREGLSTREALLDYVRFSALTATIMSGNYRNNLPTVDLQNITLNIVDASGEPITGANVKIWNVVGESPYHTELLLDGYTSSNGQIVFAWGGSNNPHNNYDFLRLIKVYKDGYNGAAKYVSIFDADIAKLIYGNDILNIVISLDEGSASPVINSIACASPNPSLIKNVEFTVLFSEPVFGVDASDFTVEKTGVADAFVGNVYGEGAAYTVSVISGSSGTINLKVIDNDSIISVNSYPLGGGGVNQSDFENSEACIIADPVTSIYLPMINH